MTYLVQQWDNLRSLQSLSTYLITDLPNTYAPFLQQTALITRNVLIQDVQAGIVSTT